MSVVGMVNGAGAVTVGSMELLTGNTSLLCEGQRLNVSAKEYRETYGIVVFLSSCHGCLVEVVSIQDTGYDEEGSRARSRLGEGEGEENLGAQQLKYNLGMLGSYKISQVRRSGARGGQEA